MSVEFQVRINEPILIDECIEETSNVLARIFGNPPARRVEVHGKEGLDVRAIIERGASQQSFCITVGKDATVDVNIYNFEDPAFQEEAGTWLVAEVNLRTDLSFVLSLAFAVAVALRTRSTVLDDAGHLKLGRHLSPDDLITRLRLPVTSASLEEAASLLCQSIGFRFGDD